MTGRESQEQHDVRARLVERVARPQVRSVSYRLGNGWNGDRSEVRRQSPHSADERRTVDAGCVAPRIIVRADISRQNAVLDPVPNQVQRPMTSPAIGNAADLLSHLALNISRTTDAAVKACAYGIGFTAIGRGDSPTIEFVRTRKRFQQLFAVSTAGRR